MNKELFLSKLRQYSFISLGVIVMSFGFYFFLEPISLCTGGVLGISVILKPLYTRIPWFTTSIFLYIVDFICLIIGLIFLGKEFFIKTIYATLFSPTVVFVFEKACDPYFFLKSISDFNAENPGMSGTSTYIVCVVLSIVTVGFGIGIAIKNNGSTGGMDVIQKIMSKYLHIPLSKTMYFTDWVVVFLAGFTFLKPEATGMYDIESVLFGSVAVIGVGYVTDMIALNARNRRTAYIITTKPVEIRDVIYKNFDRGVTFSDCVGAYTGEDKTMVISTLDKNEAYRLKNLILEVDPDAFSFITSCKEVVGEYDKRGLL